MVGVGTRILKICVNVPGRNGYELLCGHMRIHDRDFERKAIGGGAQSKAGLSLLVQNSSTRDRQFADAYAELFRVNTEFLYHVHNPTLLYRLPRTFPMARSHPFLFSFPSLVGRIQGIFYFRKLN